MPRTIEDPESFPPWIGRYRVLRQLSHGAASSVYAVEDPATGRAVALKLAREDRSHSVGAIRLRNEVRALDAVQNPHVVAVHDAGEHEGLPFFTMDLINGCSIDVYVDPEPVVPPTRPPPDTLSAEQQLLLADPARVRRIVSALTQIGVGLAALHAQSIVHRDLQPAHMLVDETGFAVLVDLSLVVRSSIEPPDDGLVTGTFAFLSPEQALGQPVDARADLYCLGLVLYMLLAGRHPFYSENAVGFAYHHARKQPPPLEHLSPHVPAALRTLAHALLAKDPNARPQRIEDVLSVFERVDPDAVRGIPPPPLREAPQRHASLLDDVDAVPPARRS